MPLLNKLASSAVLVALIGALCGVFLAVYELYKVEQQRLDWDQYIRKEKTYEEILKSLDGFYEGTTNAQRKKDVVIKALRLCELHCPDEVVRAGNAFLRTVSVGATSSEEQQQRRIKEFRLGLRRDLKPETELSIKDIELWSSK